MHEDERKIRDLIAAWLGASSRGDTDTVLGLMADDVTFTVVGQKPFGKKEFAEASRAMAGKVSFQAVSDIQEIKLLGDWAWCRAYLEVTISVAGGGLPMRRVGHTLSILRKEPAGNWVIVRDANMLTMAD